MRFGFAVLDTAFYLIPTLLLDFDNDGEGHAGVTLYVGPFAFLVEFE